MDYLVVVAMAHIRSPVDQKQAKEALHKTWTTLVIRFAGVGVGIEVLLSILLASSSPSEETLLRPVMRTAASLGFYYFHYSRGLFN